MSAYLGSFAVGGTLFTLAFIPSVARAFSVLRGDRYHPFAVAAVLIVYTGVALITFLFSGLLASAVLAAIRWELDVPGIASMTDEVAIYFGVWLAAVFSLGVIAYQRRLHRRRFQITVSLASRAPYEIPIFVRSSFS